MSEIVVRSIETHFGGLEDSRADLGKRHQLLDIMVIAICGADGWVDVEMFGKAKERRLRQFHELPHGFPSHDTFGRIFAQIDSKQLETSFLSWVQAVFEITDGQVVAIDGKTVRRSHDHSNGKAAIHLVSAWATANHLLLGQVKVDHDYHRTVNGGHGCIEPRKCWTISEEEHLQFLRGYGRWEGL